VGAVSFAARTNQLNRATKGRTIAPFFIILLCCMGNIGQFGVREQNTPTLPDMISDENCSIACYMGIEPGVTTRTELIAFFEENRTNHQVSYIGLQAPLYVYDFAPERGTPLVRYGEYAIGVNVAGTYVEDIFIPLDEVSVTDILEWYGSPAKITKPGDHAFEMLYPELGLSFTILDEATTMIDFLTIRTITRTNLLMDVSNLHPCTEPANLCAIETLASADNE
jgi:hypothetical protein